jgi:hypothetical protein
MGSNKNQIIWTDFTFSGLPLALPGFSDDGLRFGFQGCLDEGSSGYGLKTGLTVWIWVFKDGLDYDTGFGRLVLRIWTLSFADTKM